MARHLLVAAMIAILLTVITYLAIGLCCARAERTEHYNETTRSWKYAPTRLSTVLFWLYLLLWDLFKYLRKEYGDWKW